MDVAADRLDLGAELNDAVDEIHGGLAGRVAAAEGGRPQDSPGARSSARAAVARARDGASVRQPYERLKQISEIARSDERPTIGVAWRWRTRGAQTALSARNKETCMETAEKTASAGVALSMVLASTRAGREELARPQAGLSLTQRKLLSRLDGQRRLADLVGADAGLSAERIARDALRLLMLGLARSDDVPDTQPRPTTVFGATRTTETRPPALEPAPTPAPTAMTPRATAPAYARSRLPIAAGVVVAGSVAVGASFFLRSAPHAAPAPVVQAASPAPAQPLSAPMNLARSEAARPVTAPAPVAPSAAPAANPHPTSPQPTPPPKPVVRAAEPAPNAPAAKHERDAAAPVPKNAGTHETPAAQRPTGTEHARTGTVLVVRGANRADAAAPLARPAPPPASEPAATLAVAPVVSTAPPAEERPRPLLPVEREFAPAESDPQRLALAAAGRAPVQRTPPIFPREALRQGVTEGSVRARLFIAADGTVERVETSVTEPRFAVFEHSARVALMTWLFMPGEPGRVHDTVVNFRAP
jgi:outer membrane biosynthesis protein TonB